MKVWIHINGIQEGPFMIEDLPLHRMSADTPVWYNGLADWMPACQAPEVAEALKEYAESRPCDSQQPQQEPLQPQEDSCQQPTHEGWQQPQQGNWQQPQQGWQQPQQGGWQNHMQGMWQQPAYPQQAYQPWRVPTDSEGRPLQCPPNYLVWSILLTVICCNPVGIVAIVLGTGVKSKFYSGDVAGARRASETTAWWLAVTIVTGLILSCCMAFII